MSSPTSPTTSCPDLLADLGGHDQDALERALRAADRETSRPTVIFAYTIKGWRLPFAGDSINHSALLRAEQVEALSGPLGADPDDPWAAFRGRLGGGSAVPAAAGASSGSTRPPGRSRPRSAPADAEPDVRIPASTSTQQTFGDTLATLARDATVGPRLVTAAPDVAVSTNLGGWINRAGVFAADRPARARTRRSGRSTGRWARPAATSSSASAR